MTPSERLADRLRATALSGQPGAASARRADLEKLEPAQSVLATMPRDAAERITAQVHYYKALGYYRAGDLDTALKELGAARKHSVPEDDSYLQSLEVVLRRDKEQMK